jgi:cytolysin-activating lysine-acyltransferase
MILGRSKPKTPPAAAPEKAQPAPEVKAEAPAPAQGPAGGGQKNAIRPRDARQLRLAQSFAQVVTVLMRDPNFRKLPLADLEWLVLPALMSGQFRLAHLQTQQSGDQKLPGMLVPVAVALWARVSPEIDKLLSEKLDEAPRLQPNQWSSGDQLWLMAAAGDPRAIPSFLQQLEKAEFKGKEVKLRRRDANGKVVIGKLGQNAAA